MVDVTLIGFVIVGLLLVAGGYVGALKRGFGTAMATLAGGVVFFAVLATAIILRLTRLGPWA